MLKLPCRRHCHIAGHVCECHKNCDNDSWCGVSFYKVLAIFEITQFKAVRFLLIESLKIYKLTRSIYSNLEIIQQVTDCVRLL